MKNRVALLLLLALATAVRAEDKVSGELAGSAEIVGISDAGVLVGDTVAGSYARHLTTAKVSVVTKEGRVHRVETYFDWSAANGIRARVWERLYVSGGSYTGWTERLIETSTTINFSRNVIDGDVDQKFDSSGSGHVEWTVAGPDNGVESGDKGSTSATSTDDPLPVVEILGENEFDGVSDRRIEIDAHGGGRPSLYFRDVGYQRISLEGDKGNSSFTVNQKMEFQGRGKGSLRFTPSDHAEAAAATPTPAPTPDPGAPPPPTPAAPSIPTPDPVEE